MVPSSLFILASSVCNSLQYLISAWLKGLKVVTYLGSVVQLCCGKGGTLQTNISGLCGESLRCLGHTGLPQLTRCVLSQSTLLRLQVALQGNCPKRALGCVHSPGLSCSGSGSRALHKGTDSVGPVLYALTRSEQLRQPGAWQVHCPRGDVSLNQLPGPHSLISHCATRVPSQVCGVSPLGS